MYRLCIDVSLCIDVTCIDDVSTMYLPCIDRYHLLLEDIDKKYVSIVYEWCIDSYECTCQKEASSRCQQCHQAYYCSRDNQLADFKIHKRFCVSLQFPTRLTLADPNKRSVQDVFLPGDEIKPVLVVVNVWKVYSGMGNRIFLTDHGLYFDESQSRQCILPFGNRDKSFELWHQLVEQTARCVTSGAGPCWWLGHRVHVWQDVRYAHWGQQAFIMRKKLY